MKMISGNQIVIAGERFRVGDVVTTSEKGIPLVSAWVLPFHDITPSFNHRFILSARDSILISCNFLIIHQPCRIRNSHYYRGNLQDDANQKCQVGAE